ncbi:hypothetical protein HDU67_008657 [Dinochytrium kinnereticum]|nr:hypothetical protein HDU67_008657 [Dinochytrium kinnereticum]
MKSVKPTAQATKDRMAKSGNPKKRTPSSGGVATPTSALHPGPQTPTTQNASGNAVIGVSSEDAEIPIVIWPEWSDSEIASEKWATKHAFEDPEGPIILPRSIRPCFEGFKRPVELALEGTVPVAVQPLSFLDEAFFSLAPTSASSNSGSHGAMYINSPGGFPRNMGGLDRLSEDNGFAATNDPSDSNSVSTAPGDGQALGTSGASQDATGGTGDHFNYDGGQSQSSGGASFSVSITSSHQALSGIVSNLEDTNSNGAVGASGLGLNVAGTGDDLGNLVSGNGGLPNVPEDDQGSEQESLAGCSKFFQCNRHLLVSDLMRTMLAQIHFLFEHSRASRTAGLPDEFCPWENLYPKAKDGTPTYNPMGKYAVKLFWLGSWRRITIDDRIPVDEQGRPLVICSPAPHEMWPMLISKALVKLATTSYKEMDGSLEHGDFDALHALKGWIPERLQIPASFAIAGSSLISSPAMSRLWADISSLNVRALHARAGSIVTGMGGLAPNGVGQLGVSSGLSALPPGGPGRPNNNFGSMPTDGRSSVYGQMPADRSSLHSAGGKNAHQRMAAPIVFAIREGEDGSEKIDINSISYPFRIADFRETTTISTTTSKDADVTSHKLVRLKSYFTCGTYRNKKDKSGKPGEDSSFEPIADGTEFWVTFNDFCKSYRTIVIYHSPLSFKTVKTTQCIIDPTKPIDIVKVPPVLYLPENSKDTTIIAMVSTYGRCKAEGTSQITSVIMEPYEWRYGSTFSGFRKKPMLRINTNGILGAYLKLSQREDFYLEDEGKYLQEKLGLSVRDVEESFPAQPANSWFVMFKNFIRISEPTFVAASLYVPDSIQNFTCLRIFDCDTNEEIPQLFYNLKPRMLQSNKSGYMILADCRNPAARGPGKWKLRLVSQPIPVVPPEKPLDLYTKLSLQDLDEIFTPNKHNILFSEQTIRYVLKVKDGQESHVSGQLSFSLLSIWIKLQVFDNDVEVVSSRGKGVVSVHAYLPPSSTDDPASAVSTSATSTTNASNKKEDKAEKKEREREERERAARESKDITSIPALIQTLLYQNLQPVIKHRYILQGSIEPSEFSKLLGMNGTAGPSDGVGGGNRPGTSRSGTSTGTVGAPKTTSSAKKKKQSVVPGFAGGTAAAAAAALAANSGASNIGGVGSGVSGAGGSAGSGGNGGASGLSGLSAGNTAGKEGGSGALGAGIGAGGASADSNGGSGQPGFGGAGMSNAPSMEPHSWKLRLISPDSASLIVSRDTEKEDRHKAIKDSWEASHPGRAAKAREARDSYLKQVEVGAIKPILFMAAPASAIAKAAPAALLTIGESRCIPITAGGGMNQNYVRNSDLVYKAWTIVKESGVNGRQFTTVRDRGVNVLGIDGQQMTPEPILASPDVAAAASIAMSNLRSLSNIRASVEGRPSVSTPPPLQSQQQDVSANSGRTTAEIDRPNRPGSGFISGDGIAKAVPPLALNVSDLANYRRFSGGTVGFEGRQTVCAPSSTLGSEERLLFESGMGNSVTGISIGDSSLAPVAKTLGKEVLTPGLTAVPNLRPRVLSAEEKQERERQREEAWQTFERFFDQAKMQRQSDREWRQRARVIFSEKIDEMIREVEKEREEDLQRREGYRQRVIREIEEAARKALEALKAAEMAALEVSNMEEQAATAANDKEKKKKAGKR